MVYAFTDMMLWEGIDKRSFPRAKYRCLVRITGHHKEKVFDTFTENIGGGGICVVLRKEIDLFKTAKLEIFLRENAPPVCCSGTIVWVIRRRVGKEPSSHEYDTGIEFTDIADKDKGKITDLVNDLLDT